MKDAAELCRGLLRKAQSDRVAMEASLGALVLLLAPRAGTSASTSLSGSSRVSRLDASPAPKP